MNLLLRILSLIETERLRTNKELSLLEKNIADVVPSIVLETALKTHAKGKAWFWCAPRLFVDAETQNTLGAGSFFDTGKANEVEIGYGIAEAFWGQDIATQGVAMMLDEARREDGSVSFLARTAKSNPASARVLEKNGFEPYGETTDPTDGAITLWRKKG